MKKNVRIFKCMHCGNIINMLDDKGVPVVCCGEKMHELIPGTSDGAAEKHVPVVTVEKNADGTTKVSVVVGSVTHPMTPEHYIGFILIETEKGVQYKVLDPAGTPEACFTLCKDDGFVAAYEYCNLHGLWKA